MAQTRNSLHTSKRHTDGDRDAGVPRSTHSHLDVRVSPPGAHGSGAYQEQVLAAGWSVCFEGAVKIAIRKTGDAYLLRARLNISLASLER
ncbi:hypothetical protein NKJ51_15920 [Mesorhizobium sp. M0134]|uniref:hypothetical protein n=1 Tax=Mesorhizobium sp. M0134 TaxID=2956889 RepID=UPI00333AE6FA